MQIVYERCCGLDVHKKTVVACSLTPQGKEIRTFGTMTHDLRELINWIKERQGSHVAMESTGVFWKPIFNLLEMEGIEATVFNAQHIKNVPGRKTDVKDAEWIAQLLRHGLVQGSFIPDRAQREIRELVRYRTSLVQERAREANRIQKTLEGANIKLASVVSDILGTTSSMLLEGLIAGNSDPQSLASKTGNRLKADKNLIEQSLTGFLNLYQRTMLRNQLEHIRFLNQKIEDLNREVEDRLRPFDQALELIDSIPGIGIRTAQNIVAELGINMERFPSAHHLASWAGLAPGNNESAGKRKSGATKKGSTALRSTLVEAAVTVVRMKNTYFTSQYHRLVLRRGKKRAIVAVAHSMLVAIYHMLLRSEPYRDLGTDFLDKRNESRILTNALKRITALGYQVSVSKLPA
jgi:transposase